MRNYRCLFSLLVVVMVLAGCATVPSAKVHYTVKNDPGSRPIQQLALLPVDVDVYEMSAGGVKEEVPEWSRTAEENIRAALLISRDSKDDCCATRQVDTSALTPGQREVLEEHLALFNLVAANAIWTSLPVNSAWHFKSEHFDYTLGDGLRFLKTDYDVDAGLIVLGEDVVSSAGRKTAMVVGAMFGVVVPLGHSVLIGGLVDFETGDLLWMNYKVAAGATDLRDSESCLELARQLMEGYPGLRAAKRSGRRTHN